MNRKGDSREFNGALYVWRIFIILVGTQADAQLFHRPIPAPAKAYSP